MLYLLYTLRQGISLASPITYYWTDSNSSWPSSSLMQGVAAEAARSTIRQALMTWN